MHWLIDAGAIKTGGGVQIALNRLPPLTRELLNAGYQVSVLLPSEGPLANIKLESSIQIVHSPNNPIARFIFEYLQLPHLMHKNNVQGIYTVFGFGLPHPKNITSIVNTANATTCYPDSIYWQRIRGYKKIKRIFYTWLRQSRLKKADHWIFETEVMRTRSVAHLRLPYAKTHVINPSPTSFITAQPAKKYHQTTNYKITLLTGDELHKNLDCLVSLCRILDEKKAYSIQFNITLTKDQLRKAIPKTFDLDTITNINYLGKIPQQHLQAIYDDTDIIMNLSELESFSNNYMEAWKAGLAQICSDRDFAHHICGNSALYIEPLQPESAANQIITLLEDRPRLNAMAEQGKIKLSALTPPEAYIDKTVHLINRPSQWVQPRIEIIKALDNQPMSTLDRTHAKKYPLQEPTANQ